MKRFLFLFLLLSTFGLHAATSGVTLRPFQSMDGANGLLRSNPNNLNTHVVVESYWAGLNKGGGELIWDATSSAPTNRFSVFKSQSTDWTSSNGRWLAYFANNVFDAARGGSRGNYPTSNDDVNVVQNIVDTLETSGQIGTVLLPRGSYDLTGLIIGKNDGFTYSAVNGIRIIGEAPSSSDQNDQVKVYVTNGLAAGILMQYCENCSIENINFVGKNSFYSEGQVSEATFATFLTYTNFISGVNVISTNRYAPHAAIAIDPFSSTTPSQYPGLAAWYVGTAGGFSSGVTIKNCTFTDFFVPIVVSPGTNVGGVHRLVIDDSSFVKSTVGIGFGTGGVNFVVRNSKMRDVYYGIARKMFGAQTGEVPYVDGGHWKFVTYPFEDPFTSADEQINNLELQSIQSITPLIATSTVNTNRISTVGNATLDRLQVKPDGAVAVGNLELIDFWGDLFFGGETFASARDVSAGDPNLNISTMRLRASDNWDYWSKTTLAPGAGFAGALFEIYAQTNSGGPVPTALTFGANKNGKPYFLMDANGTNVLQIDPGDAGLSGVAAFTLNGTVPANDLVNIQLLGTNQFRIAPVTGYTGTGTNFFADDGTFKPGTGGGGTVAGSDTHIQFNDLGVHGADADFSWDKTLNTLAISGRETINGGALTGSSSPSLLVEQTWNNGVTLFEAFKVFVTNTASGSGSTLGSFSTDSSSVFTIAKQGQLELTSGAAPETDTSYGLYMHNGTIATSGNPKPSPLIRLSGTLFNTTTGSAQIADTLIQTIPYSSDTNLMEAAFYTGVANSYTKRFSIWNDNTIILGSTSALATTATNGFPYIPTMAGTPTGTPRSFTGKAPLAVDSANDLLYFYSGGAWHSTGGSGGSSNWTDEGTTNAFLQGIARTDSLVVTNISHLDGGFYAGNLDTDSTGYGFGVFGTNGLTRIGDGFAGTLLSGSPIVQLEVLQTLAPPETSGLGIYGYFSSAIVGKRHRMDDIGFLPSIPGNGAGGYFENSSSDGLNAALVALTAANATSQTNVAFISTVLDDVEPGVGPANAGVFVITAEGQPLVYTSSVILADNQDSGYPVFIGRTNGVEVFRVNSNGVTSTISLTVGVTNVVAALAGKQPLDSDLTAYAAGPYAAVTNALSLTGSTTTFLRSDGTQATPAGSGGTVTSVSVTTANGVSGSVATATTTPAITLTLGAITPSSVVIGATNVVAALNLKAPLADPIFTGSLQLPNGAAPTVDAFGEIAGDNNLWAASRGAPVFFDGTAAVGLVGALVSDAPSNGQVPTWNTGGTITWETPSGGSSGNWVASGSTNSILSGTGFAGGLVGTNYITIGAGSSTNFARVGGTLDVNITPAGSLSTTETDLMTYSVAANTLAVDKDTLRVRCAGGFTANSNLKTVNVYFGAFLLFTTTAQAFNGSSWVLNAEIIRDSDTTQIANVSWNSDLSSTATISLPDETLSGAVVFKVTGTGVANIDVYQRSQVVEFLPTP